MPRVPFSLMLTTMDGVMLLVFPDARPSPGVVRWALLQREGWEAARWLLGHRPVLRVWDIGRLIKEAGIRAVAAAKESFSFALLRIHGRSTIRLIHIRIHS